MIGANIAVATHPRQTVPGTREERGLTDWASITETDGEFSSAVERASDRLGSERPPFSGD
ncbi:MAG: hypothetical protein ABEJ47_00105 [Halorhabdus sp.]